MSQRRKFGADLKAKVALEAMREQQTLAEIATKYKLHQNQVSAWKKDAIDAMSTIFKTNGERIHHSLRLRLKSMNFSEW